MLLHNVYFYLKDGVTSEQEQAFSDGLKALVSIDLIASAKVGKPAATEARPVTDHGFHTSLLLAFTSQANHDAYQIHPDHEGFVDSFKDLWASVKVYDTQL